MMKKISFMIVLIVVCLFCNGQLKAGFDKQEYINLMKVSAQFGDSNYSTSLIPAEGYRLVYRSPAMGLDNRWQLWTNGKGAAIISIRGTTKKEVSWLANFYAAMIPAKGELQLSKDYLFNYKLSSHPRAAVHVGWTIGLGFLVKEMRPKIDSAINAGTKDFLIVGHSQGGAISYLLTAYLHHLKLNKELPEDVRIKTYCSAAPKPGNSYFAYEYEAMTQGGWAFNVINAADWVPQTPFSVQGLYDFNEVNPFVNAKTSIKRQSWPKRWAYNYAYGKMTKPAKKALKTYQKYLGQFVSKSVKENLDGFEAPEYFQSNDYVRTGTTVVLYPDEDYYKKYPQDKSKAFINHLHPPYLYLANKLDMDNSIVTTSHSPLSGSWQLNYISGLKIAFEGLYPGKKPFLNLDVSNSKMTGNTSCNNISGNFRIESNHIFFGENMIMTKMFCEGEGEPAFLNMLKKVNAYSVNENTLTFMIDDVAVMRFERKG